MRVIFVQFFNIVMLQLEPSKGSRDTRELLAKPTSPMHCPCHHLHLMSLSCSMRAHGTHAHSPHLLEMPNRRVHRRCADPKVLALARKCIGREEHTEAHTGFSALRFHDMPTCARVLCVVDGLLPCSCPACAAWCGATPCSALAVGAGQVALAAIGGMGSQGVSTD